MAGALTAILTLLFLLFPELKPGSGAAGEGTSVPAAAAQPPPVQPASNAPARAELPPAQPAVMRSEPVQAASLLPSDVPGDVIIGAWRQYLYVGSEELRFLGTFVVGKSNGVYTMAAREQVEAADVINSIGIFDVACDGEIWTFKSNWGQGRVGQFVLQRVSPTIFDGSVYFDGGVAANRWIKVE